MNLRLLLDTRAAAGGNYYYYHSFLGNHKIVRYHSYASQGGYNGSRIIRQLERFMMDECKSGRIKNFDDGLKYFDLLILERPLPSNDTLNHVFGSLSKIKCYSDVILLFKKMNLVGVQPGKVNHGFCLLGEMLKRGYHPDTVTYTTLIKGLCLQAKIDLAIKIPDGVSYNAIIDTLCKEGLLDQALVLFSEMLNDSNIVLTYNILINGFGNSGRLKDVKRLFDEMLRRGISANLTTYNSMIHSHCVNGQHEEARRYFDEMMFQGISPDTITFGRSAARGG
ncbi:pentatricopeptide repeat-containing protein At1g62680, mitochondrial-like [Papaver somniferum]|uniref:pentatricopeptide repeat-containing protein At1g62680, mitochondrial-like n=1 Tax=Papaver somniferum TaxID=3469 RepID=UPI000E6FB23F|nr:pentatricopeptide repeat-containing protein At1g62680, mitochondrial-like [Papaver somniferum]